MTVQFIKCVIGISCNARDCDRTFNIGPYYGDSAESTYSYHAARQDWTGWQGARVKRNYCPDHRPPKGTRMWQAWGYPLKETVE